MSWLKEAVMYHIFIDRFSGYDLSRDWRKAEHMGGNLRGIIDKFDYIKELGIDTIWLSPFYKATSYHGYDIVDYYAVDEHFGTEQDLAELIELAHRNKMKIIADFVPNHVSYAHPFFIDAQQHRNSPYRDWFIFDNWPQTYRVFITYPSMPKLNLHHPEALEHVLGAARKWLQFGLDGYRIDHIIGLANDTVDTLFGHLKQEFPACAFFGEAAIFGHDGEPATSTINIRGVKTLGMPHRYLIWVLKQYGLNLMYRNYVGRLDGMLDFYFVHHMARFARTTNAKARKRILHKLRRHATHYPSGFSLVTFLDNHDVTRYLFRCAGNIDTLLAASSFQFSLPGPKAIYYGTEVGVTQEKSFVNSAPTQDIQARMPMIWESAGQNQMLLDHYKKLISDHAQNLHIE